MDQTRVLDTEWLLVRYQKSDQGQLLNSFLGVGFFFALIMLCLTAVQSNFSRYTPSSSEEFTVRRCILLVHVI
jgi:hypothetical protein